MGQGIAWGISCPALYCQGLCVWPDAAGSPLGSSLGRAAANAYSLSGAQELTFLSISFRLAGAWSLTPLQMGQASPAGA